MNHLDVIRFYKEQIMKFEKLGIGKETEFKVTVTQAMIDCTKERLIQLQCGDVKKKIKKQTDLHKKGNVDIKRILDEIVVLEYNLMQLKENVGLLWTNYVVNAGREKG